MIHKTAPHDAAVHESGWVRIGDVEVTALPLVDLSQPGMFARLTYRDAIEVAKREGAQLLDKALVDLVWITGHKLKPVILKPTVEMASLAWCREHDAKVWAQLTGWDEKTPVANAGKDWLRGAKPGRAMNYGWIQSDGKAIQPAAQAHDDLHVDYSQLTRLVRPARASLGSRIVSGLSSAVSWLVSGLRPTAALVKPSLGEALLEEARKDLHVREVGGMNRGPEVDAYNVALGVPLGSSWCASSLTTWLRRACVRLGVPMPIPGSAGAKTIMSQLQKAGRWLDVAELRRNPKLLRPGMVLVWDRGGWKGHVGVFAAMRSERGLATVEGNSGSGPFGEGNRVADDMPRTLDDPRLLGAGWVD